MIQYLLPHKCNDMPNQTSIKGRFLWICGSKVKEKIRESIFVSKLQLSHLWPGSNSQTTHKSPHPIACNFWVVEILHIFFSLGNNNSRIPAPAGSLTWNYSAWQEVNYTMLIKRKTENPSTLIMYSVIYKELIGCNN